MSLNETLLSIQHHINLYYCPLALLLGVSGCFFNIVLFSQKQFQNISCCTYFRAASILMLLVLLIGLGPHVYSAHRPNLANEMSVVCKIRAYSGQSLTMMYRWLMTMACIDRYFASSLNVLSREWISPRLANRIILFIVLIWIILPVHNLYFVDIREHLCTNSRISFAIYHSLFTLSLGGFLPPVIMLVFIVLIYSNLRSKRRRRQLADDQAKKDHIVRSWSARDQQVLLMLLVQVTFYILCTIPWMIFLLYAAVTRRLEKKSTDRRLIERFVRFLTEILIYMYPTLSFYVYTLTSTTFRSELLALLLNTVCSRRRSSHAYQTNNARRKTSHRSKQVQYSNFVEISLELSDRTLSSEDKNVSMVSV